MHHTDYSHHLRKTQHKSLNNLSTNRSDDHRDTENCHELLRATITVLLVVIALMQMDPANARTSSPAVGYGNLVVNNTKLATTANQIQLLISDHHIDLMIDQSFKNKGGQARDAHYLLPVPDDTQILGWRIQIGHHVECLVGGTFLCPSLQKPSLTKWSTIEPTRFKLTGTNSNNQLRVPIALIKANETIRVQLDIQYPTTAAHQSLPPLLPMTDDFEAEMADSVDAVVQSMHSMTPVYPIGALLPL